VSAGIERNLEPAEFEAANWDICKHGLLSLCAALLARAMATDPSMPVRALLDADSVPGGNGCRRRARRGRPAEVWMPSPVRTVLARLKGGESRRHRPLTRRASIDPAGIGKSGELKVEVRVLPE